MALKNQKRSGGPTSPEGKLIASQNSIQTGTYSNVVVLPGENQEEFNQLLDQCNHDFQPTDVIEKSLVREMAAITWRKLRLEKLENDYFIKKLNAPITLEELIDCNLKFDQERYDFWSKRGSLDEEEASQFKRTLELIKPYVRLGVSAELIQEVRVQNAIVYGAMVDYFRQQDPFALPEISDEELVDMTVQLPKQPERFLTSVVFERFVSVYEAALWCTKKQEDIKQAIVQIKQERLLKLMQSEGLRRANDDLTRSMVRVLGEFRKHNQWRLQHRVIDVEEK